MFPARQLLGTLPPHDRHDLSSTWSRCSKCLADIKYMLEPTAFTCRGFRSCGLLFWPNVHLQGHLSRFQTIVNSRLTILCIRHQNQLLRIGQGLFKGSILLADSAGP